MKRFLKLLVLLYCILIMGNHVYAETEKVIYSDITAYINGFPIPSYNFYGETVVIAKDLENYGFDLNYVDEERCLYIEYNPDKKVTANYNPQKENKKIGSVAFTAQATDIYTRVNGFNITYGTSYSINGQLLVNIDGLEHCHSSYITWNGEKRTISFDYMPYWEIKPHIAYEKVKTEEISDFFLELTRPGKEDWFNVKGKNDQYLSSFRVIWCEKTPVRDFTKSWFENAKITIDFSIDDHDIAKTEQLMQLLNAILTINSEGNAVIENIAAANEHIKVFINGERIAISAIELRPNFGGYTYYIELEKEVKNLDEIQSVTIECK
ncbi:hypothetical protein [Clostridium sp. MD294]|uniref:hypothetical protein n=1 Tax=Clostridium sp. MD294 TaxID=97138 RepID=UPI0002CC6B61|nr:hypothetical protein [Clostridium sp. MD294]NDO47107.1 hypothetical protein [Clostridium sp. MD294]USF31118.1 hypothetical protein C820_002564 [Clostridium sp. MD294]